MPNYDHSYRLWLESEIYKFSQDATSNSNRVASLNSLKAETPCDKGSKADTGNHRGLKIRKDKTQITDPDSCNEQAEVLSWHSRTESK